MNYGATFHSVLLQRSKKPYKSNATGTNRMKLYPC